MFFILPFITFPHKKGTNLADKRLRQTDQQDTEIRRVGCGICFPLLDLGTSKQKGPSCKIKLFLCSYLLALLDFITELMEDAERLLEAELALVFAEVRRHLRPELVDLLQLPLQPRHFLFRRLHEETLFCSNLMLMKGNLTDTLRLRLRGFP